MIAARWAAARSGVKAASASASAAVWASASVSSSGASITAGGAERERRNANMSGLTIGSPARAVGAGRETGARGRSIR